MDLEYADYLYFARKIASIDNGLFGQSILLFAIAMVLMFLLVGILILLFRIQKVAKNQAIELAKLNAFFNGRPVEIHQPGIPPIPRHESET